MKKHPKILTTIPGKSNILLSMSRSNNTNNRDNVCYWFVSELLCFILCIKNKIVAMGW